MSKEHLMGWSSLSVSADDSTPWLRNSEIKELTLLEPIFAQQWDLGKQKSKNDLTSLF
jgi:hypothetical protein